MHTSYGILQRIRLLTHRWPTLHVVDILCSDDLSDLEELDSTSADAKQRKRWLRLAGILDAQTWLAGVFGPSIGSLAQHCSSITSSHAPADQVSDNGRY